MWPWGHAALGYLCFSVLVRLWPGKRVSDRSVLTLAVATQFPDLVDKSLAWGLDVAVPGYFVGHSVFVAVPVGIALLGYATLLADRPVLGAAIVVGWWSHLLGDVLFAVLAEQPVTVGRVLWPAVRLSAESTTGPLAERIAGYLEYTIELVSGSGGPLVAALLVGTPLLALFLWIADGTPVLSGTIRWVRARGT